ncbi:unnamed protein product [Schistosoma mattheei]|uniref:Uncharacterized protein n=1 Tax=Schistosoma mattheei TaxID=31246 RepID=A0A3P8BJ56_9TREM|nr:unnamed protein product [Schistosoma mattheei]
MYHHYCYASIQFNINVYILGLHRSAFDHSNTSFDEHVEVDHNVWNYIYFIIYLRTKLTDDLTGLEIYIDKLIKENEFKWIPRRRAMTLYNIENGSSEKSEEITALTNSLNKTVKAMDTLNESYQKLSKLYFNCDEKNPSPSMRVYFITAIE